MSNRSTGQTMLLVLGTIILIGGLVCVGIGFTSFGSSDPGSDDGASAMALFAAGGLAAVIGLGIIAFTRASIMTGNGGYARVTFEQGTAPTGGRFCPGCGRSVSPSSRFCDSCGAAVG
jgi:zinc-ribbon domain